MALVLAVEPNFISPYVFACFVTLREKGLPFEMRVLDASRGETRTASYLEQTITGRVPTLEHDGFALGESGAIVEYLDEVFPTPRLVPTDVRDRARCRQLMSWLRSDDTAALREERPTTSIFYRPTATPLSEDARRAASKVCEVAARLLGEERSTLFGEFSIADAELTFMLHRLIANDDPLPPALKQWAQAHWSRPSIKAYVELERPELGEPH